MPACPCSHPCSCPCSRPCPCPCSRPCTAPRASSNFQWHANVTPPCQLQWQWCSLLPSRCRAARGPGSKSAHPPGRRWCGARPHAPAWRMSSSCCAPVLVSHPTPRHARARAQLTGRYPWGAGFYDMSNDGEHCTDGFKLLPALLRQQGYSTVRPAHSGSLPRMAAVGFKARGTRRLNHANARAHGGLRSQWLSFAGD